MMNRYRKKHLLFIMLVAIGFILANSNYQFQLEVIPAGTWETIARFDSGDPSTYDFWDNESNDIQLPEMQSSFVTAGVGNYYVDATESTTYGSVTNGPPSGMGDWNPLTYTTLTEAGYTGYTYATKTSYTGGSKPTGWLDTYITWDTYYCLGPLGSDYSFGSVGYTTQHDMTSYGATRIRWSWFNYGIEQTELGDAKLHYYAGGGYSTVWSSPAGRQTSWKAESYIGSASSDVKVRWYMSSLSGNEQFAFDNLYLEGRTTNTWYRFQAVFRFDGVDYLYHKVTLYVDFYSALTGSDDLDFYLETGDSTPDNLVADNKQDDFSVDVSNYISGSTIYLDIRDDYRTGDTVQTLAKISGCYLKVENTAPTNDQTPICLNLDDTNNLYARNKIYNFSTSAIDPDALGVQYIDLTCLNGATPVWTVRCTSFGVFSETVGADLIELTGGVYSASGGGLDVWFGIKIEWSHPDASAYDLRQYARDFDGAGDTDDYTAIDYDYETRLDWSSVPAVTDDDAGTIYRGDLNEAFTMEGTLKYYGSTLVPPDAEVDVWVSCAEYGTNVGPWSDLLGSSGTYSVTCYADDVVGQDTYTMKPVKNGAGSGGSSLYYTTDLTDTYIADVAEIYMFNSSDYRDDVGTTLELRVKARLAYDDEALGSGDSITLNTSLSMTWDAVNGWFDYNPTAYSYVVAHVYNVTAASETAHGVTEFVWHSGVDSHADGNYLDTNQYAAFQLQTFTLTFWWMSESYRDGVDAANGENFVIWRNYNGGTTGGFLLPYRNWGDNDGLMRWYAIYNNTASGQSATYKHTYHNAYQWYFGTYAVNSTGYCWVYVDGVLQYEWQASSFQEWCYIANRDVTILGDWGDDWPASGDEFRFYNRVLDADEVLATMYGHYDDTGLVAYYPFDGDFNDYSGNGYDCAVVGSVDPTGPSYPQKLVWDSLMVSYSLDESREDVGSALRVTATISYAFDQWAVSGLTTTWSPSGSVTDVGDGTYYVDYTKNYVYQQDTYISTISGSDFGITTIGNVYFDSINDWIDCGDLGNPAAGTIALWFLKYDTGVRYLLDGRGTGNWWFLTHYLSQDVNFNGLVSWNGMAINTWYHVVVTADASETKLYINGVLEDTGTALAIDFRSVRIATRYTNSGYFSGQMRDFRIYGRVIDAVEAYELYQGHYSDNTDLLLYYPISSFNADDSTWYDTSGNNNDGIVYSATANQIYSPVYTRPIWDALAFDIYIDNDRYDISGSVTITCKAVYAYDGTTFTDAGGSTLTFQTFGAATYSGGLWTDSGANSYVVQGNYYVSAFTDGVYGLTKITSGFYFAGTDDHLEIPHDSSQTAISDMTIEGWFYPTSSAESKVIVAKAYGASRQFMVWWLSTSQIGFVYKNTTYFNIGCSPTGLALNTWHHFVITIDNYFNLNAWYDGIHYREDYTLSESLIQRDVNILIGCREYSSNDFTQDFIGYISHLRMYSRALTDDECYAHYQRHYESETDLVFALTGSGLLGSAGTYGQWIDSTANDNDATAYNGAAMFQNSGGDKRVRPIWDGLMVNMWVSDGRDDIDDAIIIYANFTYAWDGALADVSSVVIETVGASESAPNLWYISQTRTYVTSEQFAVDSFTDDNYGLTQILWWHVDTSTSEYVNVPDHADLKPAILTVATWIRLTDASALRHLWCTKWYGWSSELDTTHRPFFRVYNGGDSPKGDALVVGDWYLFVGVYNPNGDAEFQGNSLFINGIRVGTTYQTGAIGHSTYGLDIGKYRGGLPFGGNVRDVRIYNRALTADEILLLYYGQEPSSSGLVLHLTPNSWNIEDDTWYDMSGLGHDGTIYGDEHEASTIDAVFVNPVWDRIEFYTSAVDNSRINVNVNGWVFWEIRYDYDDVVITSGLTANLNGSKLLVWNATESRWDYYESKSTVQKIGYEVLSATETHFGLTVWTQTAGDQNIIWDAIGINMWISDGRDNIDDTITVYAWLTYLYDRTNVTDGTVLLNGTGMSYSSQIWSLGRSQSTVGLWVYHITSISGNAHGITVVGWNEFNGADETDYVNAPDSVSLSVTGSITVSVWIYIDSYMTDQPTYYILSKGSDSWGSYHIRMDNNTNLLRFIIGDPASQWGADSVYLTQVLSTGEWHLITGVWDSDDDELRIYWNGVLNNTDSTTYASIYDEDVYGLTLGCLKEHYYYFNGSIDSVRIYNRSLSTVEIHELHQGRYSNNTGLVFHVNMISWNVADNTWYDLSGEGNDATIYGPVVSAWSTYHPNDDSIYIRPIWDRLVVSIQADNEDPDTGATVTFTITVTYEFDSVTCTTWTVNVQRNSTADWVSRSYPTTTFTDSHAIPVVYQYLANLASETIYGITVFSTNTETVEWHNQIPYNVSLSVDYDDTDNWYARYRYYLITFTVGDNDGYANIETVQIALYESTRTTMYWSINYTQATDTFTEAYGSSKIVLAGWTYDDSSGNQIILYIYIKVEWSHGELTDADFRGYVIDDEAESDLDWYDENAEIVCTLDYTVTPTVTDAVADGTRGDISGSITGAGTVIYYGSGNNYPLANETDVWILHDVSGTWSDEVDGSGAFSKAMTADSSVRESTYTIKVVIQGAGSGGTDLYYTTTVTDTYISDSLTITITDPTDPEQRIDLNVNATGIVVSAVYDYDSATYDGTFTLNSTTFSYATVGKRGYTVSSASGDDSFGITAISTNDETYCIWDEMIVLYILADDDVSYLGLSVNFTVGLQYKYDSDNVQTGTFSLEALALAFSAGANWTVSDSHGTSGTWLYNDVTGTDGAYSLTGIDMDSNSISVVWDTIVISASLNYDWTLIGYNLTITTTGTFEHLGYTWNGTPTWSGTDYPEESTIGNYTYTLNSITDPDYGVTTFTNDPTLWAIFDTVNCSRSALYWKNTLDADWLYLDTAAFFFGFNESGLTENFKIQSYYGYPDASTSSDYAYVNNHSQIDRLIIGNFSGAGMDTINVSYSAVCTILGEPEYRIWSYDMSYLDVRNVVYEDTVFVDAGARAYILNNEEVRNEIHIVLYNNSMIAGSYAKDGTSIWVRVLAYREDTFPTKEQIWSGTKSLSTNTGGTVVWSLRNWDAWNICNKWNTATSPFIYIHYSTVSSGGPWTFINAFHALGSNYNLDPYSDATWTVDLERSQVLVESDWSPDRENLTAWMEADGLTPYGYGEFSQYEWINAENWNRYVWEALVTIWADFGAPITGPAPLGMPQYVLNREPIGTQPLGVITAPLTGWQIASGVDDISYFWLDVFPQWAFWYEEDGQWYQTADYDISLWLRTRLENNILWSPWYQKLADPNNYETGQHFQENLVQPFDYRDTELSIAGERVALSGDITFSFDYIIYENDVNVGTGSVNITPTLNVWSQFAIYWDRQQGTGNVNYSIYCNTTAYEEWSSQSLWINGTYSKAEPPSGFTIEQFEVEYDDVYINIYCETNWANSTLYLYVDGSLKATSAEADIIQYRKSMTEGTHTLDILIDAGSQTRWRNYTYAIGVDAITLKIIEFEWDTGSSNTYSCFVRTNWGNATVRLLEDGNTRFIQTEIGKGMSFRLSKVQRIGVHTVTLQIDAGGQILTYVLGYSYREPDHPSDTPDVGPVLSVIGDELSDSIEGKVVLHPALVGFFLSTAFMAVIILIIVFKWLLKEPIL